MKTRANYSIISTTPTEVFLVDNCNEAGTMSVTNDAEAVVAAVYANYTGRRIFYRDTEGRWDELVHKDGVFVDFARGKAPQ
jgi:hypothetical protein